MKMMKKSYLYLALLLLTLPAATACDNSDDDDDRFVVCPTENIEGKWRFVEMLDGVGASFETHRGATQPAAHTLEFMADGGLCYTFDDGTAEESTYSYVDPTAYGTYYPVIVVSDSNDGSDTPFSVELEGDQLRLHYVGPYFTDHIPETYVYQRIR